MSGPAEVEHTSGFDSTLPRLEGPSGSDDYEFGRIIDGRYRVLAQLGEGGMGKVYRVEHVRMGKVMALKIMRRDSARKRTAIERFRREVNAISKLDHPNVISVFDSSESADGILYFVMEYLPGKDLAAILRDDGPLSVERAIRVVIQVLSALSAAHAAGIVHRDIKPGNIMMMRKSDDERVKVLDFGVAKSMVAAAATITGNADLVGTPSCMSPEQARGLELDARSDIYSTAALLFELLTGRGPFIGSAFEIVSQHLVCPPPTLKAVTPNATFSDMIEAVVARGLAKDVSQRFQTAAEMREALQVSLGAPPSSPSIEPSLEIARREDWDAFERAFRRRHVLVRALAIITSIGAIAVGAGITQHETEVQPTKPIALLEEHEPNDRPSGANPIEPGKPIRGRIGPTAGDFDFFELTVDRPIALRAEVTGVRDVNLAMHLYSQKLQPIAAVDDGAISQREVMNDVVLESGHYYLRLMDRRTSDDEAHGPRSNASDYYMLKVNFDEIRPFQEHEPNNDPSAAQPVAFDQPILGRGGSAAFDATSFAQAPIASWSIDQYRFDAGGHVCAVLVGLPRAILRLTAFAISGERGWSLGSTRIGTKKAGGSCAKVDGTLYFEVRVEIGDTGDSTYPLAFIGDRAGGFSGLLALADELDRQDRREERRLLVERALALLPYAADADAAKKRLEP